IRPLQAIGYRRLAGADPVPDLRLREPLERQHHGFGLPLRIAVDHPIQDVAEDRQRRVEVLPGGCYDDTAPGFLHSIQFEAGEPECLAIPLAGRTVSRQVADGSNPDRDSCIQPESAVAAIEPGDELEAQEDRILERLLRV